MQRFNPFPHEYELHLDKNSIVEPVEGDGGFNLPRVTYKARAGGAAPAGATVRLRPPLEPPPVAAQVRGVPNPSSAQFKPINVIDQIAPNQIVDIVGVVQSVMPISQIQRKDGSSTDKRSMTIRDDSGASIEARAPCPPRYPPASPPVDVAMLGFVTVVLTRLLTHRSCS